ncbi:XkdX family protein [Clostridium botulinum]|nr:XkdX family protein [Clostridium botulinum]
MYKWIKKFYLMELYTNENLNVFVGSRDITEEQKQEIINSKVISQ